MRRAVEAEGLRLLLGPRPTENRGVQFDSARRQDHERFHVCDESTEI